MSLNGNMVDVVQSSTLLSHRSNDIREDLKNQPIQSSPRRVDGGTKASMTFYHLPTSSVRNTQQFKGQKTSNQTDKNIPTIYILEGVNSLSPSQRNKLGVNIVGSGGQSQTERIVSFNHNGHEPNLPSNTADVDVKLVEQCNDRKRKKPEEELISESPEQVEESYDSDSSTSVARNEWEDKINSLDDVYNGAVMSRKPLLSDGSDPVLILNLYQSHVGYTFCVYLPSEGLRPPSHVIPYSERYLLDCVDNGKIPTKLISKYQSEDKISLIRDFNNLVTEIRDYRRFSDNNSKPKVPEVRQVVLKQSAQTVQADFSILIRKSLKDRREWKKLRENRLKRNTTKSRPSRDSGDSNTDDDTDEEGEREQPLLNDKLTYDQRLELEKQLVNSTAGPLCLDPSPRVGLVTNRMQFAKLKWHTKDFRKRAQVWFHNGHSSKKRKASDPSSSALGSHLDTLKTGKWQDHVYLSTATEHVKSLVDGRTDFEPFCNFVKAWRSKNQPNQKPISLKLPEGDVETPAMDYPINCDDLKKAGLFEIPETAVLRTLPVENSVKKIEEYILETERRKRPHTTKLSIYQRNGIECYFGELEMESFGDNAPKPQSNKPEIPLPSTKCQFELGCSRSVTLYVKQFSDIFTEDGRRPCKITYQKVGQPAQVVLVNSYKNLAPASSAHQVVISANQNSTLPSAVPVSVSAPSSSQAVTLVAASAAPVVSASRISVGQQHSSSMPVVAGKAIRVPISISSQSSLSNVKPIISSQQPMVQLNNNNNNSGSSLTSASVPNSSASTMTSTIITTTTSTSPQTNPSQRSVQVVLPQPRAIQQQQTSQMATAVSSASTVQVQIQPLQQHQQLSQIYAVSANPSAMTIPTSTNPPGANVNFNLNVNSAGIVSLTPQQVLTRPHIFNVNLQQQNQQRVTIQQHNQRLTIQQPQKLATVQQQQQRLTIQPQQQQNSIRIKQQPTLATLLLTGIHPNQGSKPITVAIQPQPQNIIGAPQGNMTSPIQMDQALTSPIMIAPGGGQGGTNVNSNSLSVNLNAISLDGQIIAVSSAPHGSLQPGTTYHVAHPGSSMTMGLSSASGNMNAMNPLSAMNFIRLANSNTQLHRQGSTVSLMNPPGIIISSNNTGPGPSLTSANQSRGIQQLSSTKSAEQHQIEEISVPDLNALLGGGGQGQQQGKNIDGLNLNLNLNVNLNLSGATTTQEAANVMYENSGSGLGSTNSGISSATHVKHTGSQSISIKTEPGTLDVPQPVIKQEILDTTPSPHHRRNVNVMGVDSFLSTLCEPNSSVDFAQKLEGFGNNSNINIVSSSLSPTKGYVTSSHSGGGNNGGMNTSSSMITLSDLLGSPPIGVVSSSTQACQPMTGSNLLSPVSSSIASSTPRLSALLAGTPSADTVNVSHDGGISIVDSSTSVSSYGNLLDRLAASLQQQQQQPQSGNVARVAGSRLNPIATATPNVVEHPVLAATLTQQGNIVMNSSGVSGGNHTVSSNRPTAYRQIAPAPPPGVSHQQNQPHQLINLLGMGIVNNNTSSASSSNTQQTIRINSPASQASPSSVNTKAGINLNLPGRS